MMNGDQGAPLRFPISLSLQSFYGETKDKKPQKNIPLKTVVFYDQQSECCFHYAQIILLKPTKHFEFASSKKRMIVFCLPTN